MTATDHAIARTRAWWQGWASPIAHDGPYREAVVRSLLVLRALTNRDTGGIVAAPTTSLPEQFGGGRNWDYRYVWLRDAALTLERHVVQRIVRRPVTDQLRAAGGRCRHRHRSTRQQHRHRREPREQPTASGGPCVLPTFGHAQVPRRCSACSVRYLSNVPSTL